MKKGIKVSRIFGWFTTSSIITFFLVFFAVLPYSQRTFAQPDFDRSDGSTVIVPLLVNVLWDQSDNASDTDIVSQDFVDGGGLFDIYDTRAADDLLVPDGFLWKVETVRVFGTFDGAAPDTIQSLDVVFYEDSGGFPGEILDRGRGCNYEDIQPVDINNPSFIINLPIPCVLTPGTYWMSVRANMLFLPNGQWFWNERTTQTLNPFVWENPGNGFGTGCTSYSYALAECGADFPDLTFQLIGEEHIFPIVPALGTWGLVILSIAFGLLSLFYFYRKTREQQAFKG